MRLRAEVPAEAIVVVGLDEATPAPGVIDAITDADLVLLPPSNPVVSVGTILGSRGCGRRWWPPRPRWSASPPSSAAATSAGWPSRCSTAIGVEVSAGGVGRHYGARSDGGVLDGWLVDESDADQLDGLHAAGLAAAAVPLYMTDLDATAAMAAAAIELVLVTARRSSRRTASPRSGRATTWPRWSSPHSRPSTATSSW